MRVTNTMLTSKYTRDLNNSLADLNQLADKVSTGREFQKGSEDPIAAVKAYRLRRETSKNEDYIDNLEEVDSILMSAESSLMGLENALDGVYTLHLKGINGTYTQSDREIVAEEIRRIQESMVTTLNAQFNGKYLFSGASMEEPPFTVDGNGDLLYKGINMNTASNDPAATPEQQAAYESLTKLMDENMFIDTGLSLDVDDATGEINPNSVMDLAIPGISFLGFGEDNLYNIMSDLIDNLESDDFDFNESQDLIGQFNAGKDLILQEITNIGATTNYVDFLQSRADDNSLNLATKTQDIEYVDAAEAITNWMMQQYAYSATLQMGNKIIQPSFLDFMQ